MTGCTLCGSRETSVEHVCAVCGQSFNGCRAFEQHRCAPQPFRGEDAFDHDLSLSEALTFEDSMEEPRVSIEQLVTHCSIDYDEKPGAELGYWSETTLEWGLS